MFMYVQLLCTSTCVLVLELTCEDLTGTHSGSCSNDDEKPVKPQPMRFCKCYEMIGTHTLKKICARKTLRAFEAQHQQSRHSFQVLTFLIISALFVDFFCAEEMGAKEGESW